MEPSRRPCGLNQGVLALIGTFSAFQMAEDRR
jgi:hypothetical protein